MKAQDIKAGYETPWYRVIKDAEIVEVPAFGEKVVRLVVQFVDGGREPRYFDLDHEVQAK